MIYTAPVFAAAFGWVLLGETVDASFVAVLTLNFLGVVCVAQPSFLFGGPDAEPGHSHGLCLALAVALQTQGYQRARAARGSVVGATEIPFSYALQWFLFGKEPTQFGLAGSLLIMTASAGNAYVQFSREANLKRLREAELSPRGLENLELSLCAE